MEINESCGDIKLELVETKRMKKKGFSIAYCAVRVETTVS